ncbi:uncharacterized protein LOC110041920 isoform X2 [Orbicella faveolata]|uniref:uncharacterized protein LOC110041920 isoform X2 n=1 Tax=Orbicella faveolata TaxID=48498 RepID=UPI0009E19B25|nr:uncharacterized protein LOC110041920 isoform X2 [Orbicella faveolata]
MPAHVNACKAQNFGHVEAEATQIRLHVTSEQTSPILQVLNEMHLIRRSVIASHQQRREDARIFSRLQRESFAIRLKILMNDQTRGALSPG